MRGRLGIILLAVLALGFADATQHLGSPTDNVEETPCFECHQRGGTGSGPPMILPLLVAPAPNFTLALDDANDFSVVVRNAWAAPLTDLTAELDLTQSPSLGLAANADPILAKRHGGTLPFDLFGDITEPRSAQVQFDVPSGATDVHVRLVPDRSSGDEAPDLRMLLWPPRTDTAADPTYDLDEGGAGEAERLELHGSHEVGTAGLGTWMAEIRQEGALSEDRAALVDQRFDVVLDVWSNVTGERTSFYHADVELDPNEEFTPGGKHAFEWRIVAERLPPSTEQITVIIEATASHDHSSSVTTWDDWRFRRELVFPLRILEPAPDPAGNVSGKPAAPVVGLGGDAPPEVIPTEAASDDGGRMVATAQVIGYATAALIVVNLWAGGMFGAWSKRFATAFFRRDNRRRIGFHNLTGYALMLAAVTHFALFILEGTYHWSMGLLLGGSSLVGLFLLGLTGALQRPLARRVGHTAWRVLHYGIAMILVGTATGHILLDGVNLDETRESMGIDWTDPVRRHFDPGAFRAADEFLPPSNATAPDGAGSGSGG